MLLVDEIGRLPKAIRIARQTRNIALQSVRSVLSGWMERTASLDAQEFRIRPIMPADAQLYPRFLAGVTAEDMRLRVLVPTRTLSAETLVRLSQLDYDRDIAFVALNQAGNSRVSGGIMPTPTAKPPSLGSSCAATFRGSVSERF